MAFKRGFNTSVQWYELILYGLYTYIYIYIYYLLIFYTVAKILVTSISDPLIVKSDTPSVKQALTPPNL